MSEGVFSGGDESCPPFSDTSFVFMFFIEAFVVVMMAVMMTRLPVPFPVVLFSVSDVVPTGAAINERSVAVSDTDPHRSGSGYGGSVRSCNAFDVVVLK